MRLFLTTASFGRFHSVHVSNCDFLLFRACASSPLYDAEYASLWQAFYSVQRMIKRYVKMEKDELKGQLATT